MAKKTFKAVGKFLLGIFLTLCVLLGGLYIHPVQDALVPWVLGKINTDSMTVKVEKFRLSFPLDVDIEGLAVTQLGDTLVSARRVNAGVSLLPLFVGTVRVDNLGLQTVTVAMGHPDSTMCLNAKVKSLALLDAKIKLADSHVDLSRLMVSGGKIDISVRTDTAPPTPPSANDWVVNARLLQLRDIDMHMAMLSTGDDIDFDLGRLAVQNGDINLKQHNIKVDKVEISRLDASYLTPPVPLVAPVAPEDTFPSVPWTVNVRHIDLDSSAVLYAKKGVRPVAGLDPDYIRLRNLAVNIDSLYNRGTDLRLPIRRIYATERCGVTFDLSGTVGIDSTAITADRIALATAGSLITGDALYGLTADTPAPVDIDLDAEISTTDLRRLFPAADQLLDGLPKARKITARIDADGTTGALTLHTAGVEIPSHLSINLDGEVRDLSDFESMQGHLDLSGDIRDVDFIERNLDTARQGINIPRLQLSGDVAIKDGTVTAAFSAETSQGTLALDGSWTARSEGYDLDLRTDRFPVYSFLPNLGIGRLTSTVTANGHGLDVFNPATHMDVGVDIKHVTYNHNDLRNIGLVAKIADSRGQLGLTSHNPGLWADITASGNLDGNTHDVTAAIDLRQLDLYRLGMADTVMDIATSIVIDGTIDTATDSIAAVALIKRMDVTLPESVFRATDVRISALSGADTTSVCLTNRDLDLDFSSPNSIDSLTAKLGRAATVLSEQLEHKRADVEQLQQALPPFVLTLEASQDNFLSNYLSQTGTSFASLSLRASNDSLINLHVAADSVITGETRLDAVDFNLTQKGKYLIYNGNIDNMPGTMDEYAHVWLNGYVADDKIGAFVRQKNSQGETGYNLGAVVSLNDSVVSLKIQPFRPTIGYKPWVVNPDNFISYNLNTGYIEANLGMENGNSLLHVYTEADTTAGHLKHQEDLNVDIANIRLEDWIKVNPYAPKIAGDLNATVRLALSPGQLNGRGKVGIGAFTYGKTKVGDFDLGFDLTTQANGALFADAGLQIDKQTVLTAKGHLNDTTQTEPFDLDVALTGFPLSLANPFLGKETATLGGRLTGDMCVTGSPSNPLANGYIQFDSATAKVAMLGTTFRLDGEKIPVDSNVITFDKYKLYAVNENPLTIDGSVDMRHLSDIRLDLGMTARNWQVVGNDRPRGADVYGKAYLNLDATARGTMQVLDADVRLTVLPQTNVTYIMASAVSDIQGRSNTDMVKFVNFNDTAQVAQADSLLAPLGMALNLTALLNVQQGSTIGVDLSANGKSRVQLKSAGTLDVTMDYMGDLRTTGRLNLDGGYVRYNIPVMGEKRFDFEQGSYVAFNGDIANPVLNVHAFDPIRANVTSSGQASRVINFDVKLNATGTLNDMNVAFDLSTNDDATVQNELQSMSAEQRANQAMNLLLYGQYTGGSSKASTNLDGNPLYGFLESTLNSWMANNVKGVDISFGIDQYDRTGADGANVGQTTSYSYRVSKTFLNDRFKVVIGGNYSTDDDPNENLSQNIVNDVSIEYMLNKSGSMYVQLFRHTGYESILEGEITQTGIGFVYRRKINRLSDMFRFLRPRRKNHTVQ